MTTIRPDDTGWTVEGPHGDRIAWGLDLAVAEVLAELHDRGYELGKTESEVANELEERCSDYARDDRREVLQELGDAIAVPFTGDPGSWSDVIDYGREIERRMADRAWDRTVDAVLGALSEAKLWKAGEAIPGMSGDDDERARDIVASIVAKVRP